MALKVIRLYLNKIRCEMGSQCSFCRKGVTWFVLSSLKTILTTHVSDGFAVSM